MTHLLPKIHFENNFLLTTKVIGEKKERMNKFFNRHDLPKNTLLNSVPGQQNKIYQGKMATKVEMYSATHESVILPVDRDRKIRTALRTNQIVGFVTVPSEKKNKPIYTPEWREALSE